MPQPAGPPPPKRDSLVESQAKIAYVQKLEKKKVKDPHKTVMMQLMELGYTDYDKNWKLVKKDKRPDISQILDALNKK